MTYIQQSGKSGKSGKGKSGKCDKGKSGKSGKSCKSGKGKSGKYFERKNTFLSDSINIFKNGHININILCYVSLINRTLLTPAQRCC